MFNVFKLYEFLVPNDRCMSVLLHMPTLCLCTTISTPVSRNLWRVSNTLVQATLGVGSVDFWSFTVAWKRGGYINNDRKLPH